jgi:hypothetical protein
VLTWEAVAGQLLNLTNVSGEFGRACARELVQLVNARAIVTAGRALAEVNLILALSAVEVKRTEANKPVGKAQTSGAIEARERLAIVDLLLAELTPVARLTRAVDCAVRVGATHATVLTRRRVAQVNERVAA